MIHWIKKLLGVSNAGASASGQSSSKKVVATAEDLVARFGHLYRPALHLVPGAAGGFCRLGGLPQMPAGLVWPMWQDKPLAFLAQLSLSELHAALPSFLPSSGFLFFFYCQDQDAWGFDPSEMGGWRVLYTAEDCTALAERAAPPDMSEECLYHPKPVTAKRIEVLPDSQRLSEDEFEWNRDGDAYIEWRQAAFGGIDHHQVLGYPTPVQNDDMEEECQLASHGINVGSSKGYKDPRLPGLKAGAKDWKLLLQLDTDDDTGWMWGDAGTLYFWVREEDAKAADFGKVWIVFQCC